MDYVVGSGPTGISCAQALVAAGREVTLLDSGLQLETERANTVKALASKDPGDWDPAATAFLREGIASSTSGIPLKLLYGSDFPYRAVPGATIVECDGVDTKPSYARGGLSTVWGSSVMPYRQADITEWPVSIKDLAPGYRAVLDWMPLSARNDALTELFPLYTEETSSLPMSRQACGMLADMECNREALNKHGVYFGASRLAVRGHGKAQQQMCAQCGLCMYGCPHQLIYSADQSLGGLVGTGRLHYRSGVTVRSFRESAEGVSLQAVDLSGKPLTIEAERVFLGAGVLNTTAVLLRSLQMYDNPVQIRDSQYFLLPLLRVRGTAGVVKEPLHTLAQLYLEIIDEAISPYSIHLQTYTYNDLFRAPVMAALGPFRKMFPVETFLGRLMLFQGYLHSVHSAPITAMLERNGEGDVLKLHSAADPGTKKRVLKLAMKLAGLMRRTGVMPLIPLLQMGKPGRGFHSGGSFPMSDVPKPGESDVLGRPYGLRRVHAVDSTVLPSIAATTITYTAMANAWRIGHLAATEGDNA